MSSSPDGSQSGSKEKTKEKHLSSQLEKGFGGKESS